MIKWWQQRNVRLSLTLWYVGAMVVVLAVYAAGVFTFVSGNASNALDDRLHEDLLLTPAMAEQRPDGTLDWYEDDSEGGKNSRWLQIWSPDGHRIFRTGVAERNPIPESEALASRADSSIVTVPTGPTMVRILTDRLDVYGKPLVIQVARPETAMRGQLGQLALMLLLGLPFAVAAAGIGGYRLARRALAPVEHMAGSARSITAERLSDRLPVTNPNDELGHLASVFNDTLGRLEASFEQMRRFTADVSHELRTPLTALRSVGEVGLRERRDEAAYRAIIASMLEEVDRLACLVDRLLAWSRAETGQARLAQEVIDLHELAEEVATYLGVLAEEKRQSLVVEQLGAVRGMGDRLVLRQSLINLVDNAIKYSPIGGDIRLRALESQTAAMIDVIDTGPGIPPELRVRVFDRYDRGGQSLSGEIGGTGLGLSISKWAIEVNGGHLTLEPTTGGGSTFRIALPRAGAARSPEGRRRKSVA
ncbi:MAG: hypothetical protein A3G76_00245 [Acidobacteria bacterium RIFCSPLOWO2_12_FULL_65_11]|nr:MAG: hypothetical protein A3H95_06335 [Acidobacteria bacterium RIFCSPLOWO2_02_FULL_64_15]OFW29095.1 MAG: hypothetical protein A3G76_00245 [Acidobacteria bacterium RIFCSPLOWO2_12_FULL_65_11]